LQRRWSGGTRRARRHSWRAPAPPPCRRPRGNTSLSSGASGVELPTFEFRDKFSAVSALRTLGAPDMFCDGQPDFSGIAPNLCVSDVVHEAYVKVDEEGTEAAAATAVVMQDSASLGFMVDHPFVFAIRDQLTGTIPFLGRVADPSAS